MLRDQTKVPVGYLWKKTDANGETYYAGVVSFGIQGEVPIVVFREKHEERDGKPDLVIRLASDKGVRS